ncbi:MAG: chemotaxis-specific protein-glutamate methyltransferase CheB [bacterium]|nr:chemotaxis-specific protein-glutamate methyltransferase CheB [bacterium]
MDDTITYRKIVSTVIEKIEGVELQATASDGKIALAKIGLNKPDIVLLDVSMPEMDGLETLERIKKENPEIEVVMVSGMSQENANLTVQALELGAFDFVAKPQCSSPEESMEQLTKLLRPILSMLHVRILAARVKKLSIPNQKVTETITTQKILKKPEVSLSVKRVPGKIDVIALGVSTGGPNALQHVIPKISGSLNVAILAVQHMPPVFTASLAERLNRDSDITVVEGKENDPVVAGHMYIAPGGRHMVVKNNASGVPILSIIDTPAVNSCRPSVDVLFRSIAAVYGGNVLTVILTGMGNDGASGVSTIRRKGGYSLVQDEETSIVWGMPGKVVEANAEDEIVPLDNISSRIMEIAEKGAR